MAKSKRLVRAAATATATASASPQQKTPPETHQNQNAQHKLKSNVPASASITSGEILLDESVCRVCLHSAGIVSLFDGCGADEQYRFCTLLEANEHDGLPGHLCTVCADHMRIAYDFRFQAKYAEEYFRKTTTKKKHNNNDDELDVQEYIIDGRDDADALEAPEQVLEEQVLEIDKLMLAQHYSDVGTASELTNTITSIEMFVNKENATTGENELNGHMFINESLEQNYYNYDLSGDSSDDALSDHYAEAFVVPDVVEKMNSVKNEETKFKINEINYEYKETNPPKTIKQPFGYAFQPAPTTTVDSSESIQNVSAVVTQILETSREENDKLLKKLKERKNAKVECNICGTTFTHINSLRQHLMKHSGERPFGCDFCDKTFTRRTILKIHRRLHTGDRPYSCDECISTFVTKEALNRHKQREHKDETESIVATRTSAFSTKPKFSCTICQKTRSSRYSLQAHMRTYHRANFEEEKQEQHSKKTSKRINKTPSSSSSTGGKTDKQSSLGPVKRAVDKPRCPRRMLDENGKPLPTVKYCKVCHLGFPSKWALFAHQEEHEMIQLYECDICKRAFDKKYNLLYHLQTHKNSDELIQKYVHQDPNKKVSTAAAASDDDEDNLSLAQLISKAKHTKLLNIIDKRKCYTPYEKRKQFNNEIRCLVCNKIFSTSGSLKVHLRTHSGDRPFACEHCGKRFTRNNILTVHRRQHTGDRPFKCPLCPEAAISKVGLMSHVRRFHENGGIDFPHCCEICYKTFPNKDLLVEHKQKEHAVDDPINSVGIRTRAFICKLCSQEFMTWNEFSNHIDAHDVPKPFQCGICEMRFDRKFRLLFHLETHKARKNCLCKHCGEFMTKNDRTWHIKREHFDKRHLKTPCPECREMLYDIVDLKQHLHEKHDFKDFNCDKCGINFLTIVEFEKHFNSQHDSISKSCLECGNVFDSRKAYNRHIWMHYV